MDLVDGSMCMRSVLRLPIVPGHYRKSLWFPTLSRGRPDQKGQRSCAHSGIRVRRTALPPTAGRTNTHATVNLRHRPPRHRPPPHRPPPRSGRSLSTSPNGPLTTRRGGHRGPCPRRQEGKIGHGAWRCVLVRSRIVVLRVLHSDPMGLVYGPDVFDRPNRGLPRKLAERSGMWGTACEVGGPLRWRARRGRWLS